MRCRVVDGARCDKPETAALADDQTQALPERLWVRDRQKKIASAHPWRAGEDARLDVIERGRAIFGRRRTNFRW
jgi:hypothetical protein